jgi:WD40 repeat protein
VKTPPRAKPDSIFKLSHASIHGVTPLPGGKEVLCARHADVVESIGHVERWNTATGKRLAVFEGHTGIVRSVALAFEDTRAVSFGDDHTIRLWDLDRAACLQTFAINADAIAVTDDGARLVVASGEEMFLLNLESRRRKKAFRAHAVTALAIVPGRGQVVSSSRDCSLGLWDLASGKRVRRFDVKARRKKFVGRLGASNPESATGVCVMADGQRITACYGDGTVRCWDLDSGELLHTAHCGDQWLMSVAASRRGNQVLIGGWNHNVLLWQPGNGEPVELGRHDGEVSTVAFLADDRRAISGSFDETLRVWDVAKREFVRIMGTPRDSGLAPPDVSLW